MARGGVGSAAGADTRGVASEALTTVRDGLDGERADLAAVFIGEQHAPAADLIAALCDDVLGARHTIGVTAGAVVAGPQELERPDALAVWAASMPNAILTPLHYPAPGETADPGAWPMPPDDAEGLVAFADPYTFPAAELLSWLSQSGRKLPVSGGMASSLAPGGNRLILDGVVHSTGAVAMALGGGVRLRALVSQGCRPVGRSWVITRAEQNVILELAGAPAAERLRQTYTDADPMDRSLMEQGLHVGLVIDEYQDSFGPGDFLVRGVIGADERSGAVAVGDLVRIGQTIQFQVRDAGSAREDLQATLDELGSVSPAAAMLFTCNGRGSRLFGAPGHDAGLVSAALGGAPLAGFFCAGEFGPVGSRSFLHGFTASLLLVD